MGIILTIILFIIFSIGAATQGDTSGLEIIFGFIVLAVLFWLIYAVGLLGTFIVVVIFLAIIFAIAK